MFKLENVNDLKQILRENTTRERVPEDLMVIAEATVRSMCITNTQDAFLYFASLNLLNSYVKTDKKNISYGFKRLVSAGIDGILANEVENVTFCYDAKEKSMLINVAGLQFGFHNVKPNSSVKFLMLNPGNENGKYYKQQSWEGVRLQAMAVSLFDFANNLEGLSNTSIAGNLRDLQDDCANYDRFEVEKE